MAISEPEAIGERDRWLAELLERYPPIGKLEQIMGPEPTPEEAGEVDAFLQSRARWQQPYSPPKEMR